EVAIETIERLRPQGGCEFVEDFAKVLPIHVFLDLVDLPREDKTRLLPLAEAAVRAPTAEGRAAAHHGVAEYLRHWVVERR
ncbi:cytochrome P450, partial [Escherichia coli]|nr:cytochrome P450 [Escherichia coli]